MIKPGPWIGGVLKGGFVFGGAGLVVCIAYFACLTDPSRLRERDAEQESRGRAERMQAQISVCHLLGQAPVVEFNYSGEPRITGCK